MANRDDFASGTKQALRERAANICSSPHCLKLTIGPHSDAAKALQTGCAAHIHAAAKGGPRYDENQTPEERRHISNGIWLCRECGQIVDSDESDHTPDQLRKWKADHEAMIAEVRTKGYSSSLALLQSGKREPDVARDLILSFDNHRALWVTFDAEFPDRVRDSLDRLRAHIISLRRQVAPAGPLDRVLDSLRKTILLFFNQVEHIDLTQLRCAGGDPEWIGFRDALAALRKAVGLQLLNVVQAYGMSVSKDLETILPKPED